MDTNDVLADAFGRIAEDFELAVVGLTSDELAFRPDPEANSIAWLATRVQDNHVSALAHRQQASIEDGFARRLGVGLDPLDIGYGHTSGQVAAVRPSGPEILVEYLRAVTERTLEYLSGVDAAELDRIVDKNWDPPESASSA
jgi:hypothetical protein